MVSNAWELALRLVWANRLQLLEIQKINENMKCVDCGAPSPQWVCYNCLSDTFHPTPLPFPPSPQS